MFVEYFTFSEQPFGATPDPRFFFPASSHQEALASLYCGFYENRGFTVLIAEPGMGKTMLLFDFLERIRTQSRTVFLFNTLCGPADVVPFILQDLGVTPGQTAAEQHRQLNDILLAEARAGQRLLLVIDEAQHLSEDTLEVIRLLTNFETPHAKLMHVVLSGQPELAEKLAKKELTQLFQRVSTLAHLEPFSAADTAAYIAHRLKIAGYESAPLFDANAIDRIAEASHGVPRIINTLCYNALCLCRARKARKVSAAMACEAIADLQLPVATQKAAVLRNATRERRSAGTAKRPHVLLSPHVLTALAAALLLCAGTAFVGVRERNFHRNAQSVLTQFGSQATRFRNTNTAAATSGAQSRQSTQVSNTAAAAAADVSFGKAANTSSVPVAAGDTLAGIAVHHLGNFDGDVLRQIQALNPQLTDPNHIVAGRIIRLPARSEIAKADH